MMGKYGDVETFILGSTVCYFDICHSIYSVENELVETVKKLSATFENCIYCSKYQNDIAVNSILTHLSLTFGHFLLFI